MRSKQNECEHTPYCSHSNNFVHSSSLYNPRILFVIPSFFIRYQRTHLSRCRMYPSLNVSGNMWLTSKCMCLCDLNILLSHNVLITSWSLFEGSVNVYNPCRFQNACAYFPLAVYRSVKSYIILMNGIFRSLNKCFLHYTRTSLNLHVTKSLAEFLVHMYVVFL